MARPPSSPATIPEVWSCVRVPNRKKNVQAVTRELCRMDAQANRDGRLSTHDRNHMITAAGEKSSGAKRMVKSEGDK